MEAFPLCGELSYHVFDFFAGFPIVEEAFPPRTQLVRLGLPLGLVRIAPAGRRAEGG